MAIPTCLLNPPLSGLGPPFPLKLTILQIQTSYHWAAVELQQGLIRKLFLCLFLLKRALFFSARLWKYSIDHFMAFPSTHLTVGLGLSCDQAGKLCRHPVSVYNFPLVHIATFPNNRVSLLKLYHHKPMVLYQDGPPCMVVWGM